MNTALETKKESKRYPKGLTPLSRNAPKTNATDAQTGSELLEEDDEDEREETLCRPPCWMTAWWRTLESSWTCSARAAICSSLVAEDEDGEDDAAPWVTREAIWATAARISLATRTTMSPFPASTAPPEAATVSASREGAERVAAILPSFFAGVDQ